MNNIERISEWLSSANAIVILTGAGMGVDSGLASFRGKDGRWGNLEASEDKSIFEISNPKELAKNPKSGWKMLANRLIEYTFTQPHSGFEILQKWIKKFNLDYFILTSNVDNQFQKAGFDAKKIRELHGSLFHLQCSIPCNKNIWEHNIDLKTIINDIENEKFPTCPSCGNMSRPNVYMFRDATYIANRSKEQEKEFQVFLENNSNKNLLVFEIGSGPHVQSIRKKTRMLGIHHNAKIVRINPNDFKIKAPHIAIDKGALEALQEINNFIK